MQRISRHNRLKRDLEKRAPGLIDVPLVNSLTSAVGSDVPLVSKVASPLAPVVSPLVGDNAAATPTPTPTPTPPSGGGSSGGGTGSGNNGGGGSSGGGGGSSGSGGGNGGGGSGNGGGGSSSSGGDGNGSGSNGGGGSGSSSSAGGSGSGGAGGSGSSSIASVGNGGGNGSSPPSASATASSGTSPASRPGILGSSGNGSSSVGSAPAVNVGGSPPAGSSNTASISGASPAASSIPAGATIPPAGGNTVTSAYIGSFTTNPAGSSPSGVSPTPQVAADSKGLSSGAIAGIVVVCILAALAALILCFRRRAIARRSERRNTWWLAGNKNNSSGSFSFVAGSNRNSVEHDEDAGGRASARSSFATNFDQGLMFRVQSPSGTHAVAPPAMPPMAQVGERNSALVPSASAAARRQSMNSMTSNGSDEGQYLVAYDPNDQVPTTPMSVRPFSPSESFAFPKPPSAGGKSRPISSTSSGSSFISANPAVSYPQSPASTFIPDQQTLNKYPATPAASLGPKSSTGTVSPISPFEAAENPFEDHVEKPEFEPTEIIRRPFTPSLEDELLVKPGDNVRIIKVFDDGWTFVEKLGQNVTGRSDRGLIPVDCLREAGQALPSFLSQKRVSSYAGANFEGPNYEEALAQMMSGNNIHAA